MRAYQEENYRDTANQNITLLQSERELNLLSINNGNIINEIECNKMIAFFQGAAVALDGKALRIDADIYLFARKEDLLDGSVREFVKDLKKA